MSNQLKCSSQKRAIQVMNSTLNGIDYIEVVPPQALGEIPLLLVFCFKGLTANEYQKNVRIDGGVRIKNIGVEWAQPYSPSLVNVMVNDTENENILDAIGNYSQQNVLVIRPTSNGDFSNYTLQLVDSQDSTLPVSGFDPIFSIVVFNFRVDCPSDFDCNAKSVCPAEVVEEPVIDYMAKDYGSFRQLMFNRLSLLLPEWTERNPADFGVALVELLAYVGDQLSYFQDAVATEAYLGTARKRISIRRHARLLDYFVHEGCNSRAWVTIEVNDNADGLLVPKGTKLLTEGSNAATVVKQADFDQASVGATIFETMHNLVLRKTCNQFQFYTWGEPDCCLPKGSTHATLTAENGVLDYLISDWGQSDALIEFLKNQYGLNWVSGSDFSVNGNILTISDGATVLTITSNTGSTKATVALNGDEIDELNIRDGKLFAYSLKKGDVLVLQEVCSPENGLAADANPEHRHAIRLTAVKSNVDQLTNPPTNVLDIDWDQADALPFPLCLHNVLDPTLNLPAAVSIAYGNVVLADHGYTKKTGYLKHFGYQDNYGFEQFTEFLGNTPSTGLFRPKLSDSPLTFSAQFEPTLPAASSFNYDAKQALPNIQILGENESGYLQLWSPQNDLLSSSQFALNFVVEIDNDGTPYIRFGDDELGMKPTASSEAKQNGFFAIYRVGNGKQGNVGKKTITRIANSESFNAEGVTLVRNPMEAKGGIDPEDMENVRQYAPQAFRTQERAVTEEDYIQVLKQYPGIQSAYASIRWTGSWHTAFIAIDRIGGKPVDDIFKQKIMLYFEKYRLAGYDAEITDPTYVPLWIHVNVCIAQNYYWSNVEGALLDIFSNRVLPDGTKGFFYPDNFSFGQTVYLSKIIETALKIPGVNSITVDTFQRYGKLPNNELAKAKIVIAPSEIARLDNDPNFQENGKIAFSQEKSS
jgi:hypothetical protein